MVGYGNLWSHPPGSRDPEYWPFYLFKNECMVSRRSLGDDSKAWTGGSRESRNQGEDRESWEAVSSRNTAEQNTAGD